VTSDQIKELIEVLHQIVRALGEIAGMIFISALMRTFFNK